MKQAMALSAMLVLAAFVPASADAASPIGKILQLISDLQSKVIGEGEASQKVYEEFSEFCEERNKALTFEIKTGKAEVADLTAVISEEAALIESLTTKAEKLASDIATDEADLKAATYIREKEASEFAAEKAELYDVIDTLERAIGILDKHGPSMLQLKNAKSLGDALGAMVEASMFSSADADRLNSLAQMSSEDEGDNMGAPSASTYEGHSGGILDTLGGLLEKAQSQLKEAEGKETGNLFAFQKLKQSIEDEIKYGKKELAEAKAGIASSGEKKATAEGDLAVTTKDLDEDTKTQSDLHQECMTTAQDFEAEVKSRAEELKALAAAKKAIVENTSGSDSLAYGLNQVSFVQKLSTGMDLANFEAVRFVRELSKKTNKPALAQLANRMATAMRMSQGGSDPFGKVKGLIMDMIEKLEKEAGADAKHKAYCDKELAYADEKKANRISEIEKLTTAIDEMSARSAQLKEEIAALEKALAELAASQAAMDKLRAEEKETYLANKAEWEQGIKGVKMALQILTEYYAKEGKAHSSADGAASGIIGLLEVAESDFTSGLAEMTSAEETSQAEYDQQSKDNEIEKTTKEQDVKYKTKESKDLDKSTAEATSDRSGVETELAAVNKYLDSLHAECDEVAPSYEELVAARTAEIAGLKQALEILEGEAALVQRQARRRTRAGHASLRAGA